MDFLAEIVWDSDPTHGLPQPQQSSNDNDDDDAAEAAIYHWTQDDHLGRIWEDVLWPMIQPPAHAHAGHGLPHPLAVPNAGINANVQQLHPSASFSTSTGNPTPTQQHNAVAAVAASSPSAALTQSLHGATAVPYQHSRNRSLGADSAAMASFATNAAALYSVQQHASSGSAFGIGIGGPATATPPAAVFHRRNPSHSTPHAMASTSAVHAAAGHVGMAINLLHAHAAAHFAGGGSPPGGSSVNVTGTSTSTTGGTNISGLLQTSVSGVGGAAASSTTTLRRLPSFPAPLVCGRGPSGGGAHRLVGNNQPTANTAAANDASASSLTGPNLQQQQQQQVLRSSVDSAVSSTKTSNTSPVFIPCGGDRPAVGIIALGAGTSSHGLGTNFLAHLHSSQQLRAAAAVQQQQQQQYLHQFSPPLCADGSSRGNAGVVGGTATTSAGAPAPPAAAGMGSLRMDSLETRSTATSGTTTHSSQPQPTQTIHVAVVPAADRRHSNISDSSAPLGSDPLVPFHHSSTPNANSSSAPLMAVSTSVSVSASASGPLRSGNPFGRSPAVASSNSNSNNGGNIGGAPLGPTIAALGATTASSNPAHYHSAHSLSASPSQQRCSPRSHSSHSSAALMGVGMGLSGLGAALGATASRRAGGVFVTPSLGRAAAPSRADSTSSSRGAESRGPQTSASASAGRIGDRESLSASGGGGGIGVVLGTPSASGTTNSSAVPTPLQGLSGSARHSLRASGSRGRGERLAAHPHIGILPVSMGAAVGAQRALQHPVRLAKSAAADALTAAVPTSGSASVVGRLLSREQLTATPEAVAIATAAVVDPSQSRLSAHSRTPTGSEAPKPGSAFDAGSEASGGGGAAGVGGVDTASDALTYSSFAGDADAISNANGGPLFAFPVTTAAALRRRPTNPFRASLSAAHPALVPSARRGTGAIPPSLGSSALALGVGGADANTSSHHSATAPPAGGDADHHGLLTAASTSKRSLAAAGPMRELSTAGSSASTFPTAGASATMRPVSSAAPLAFPSNNATTAAPTQPQPLPRPDGMADELPFGVRAAKVPAPSLTFGDTLLTAPASTMEEAADEAAHQQHLQQQLISALSQQQPQPQPQHAQPTGPSISVAAPGGTPPMPMALASHYGAHGAFGYASAVPTPQPPLTLSSRHYATSVLGLIRSVQERDATLWQRALDGE